MNNNRKPCVIGNWKMYGSRRMVTELVSELCASASLETLQGIDAVISPPFVYLDQVSKMINDTPWQLGAQDVFSETHGAYTGEISPSMLDDFYCKYVLIGHSERRQICGEDDDLVARKFKAAYHIGLTPVLCVGETRFQRESGKTFEVIRSQLETVIEVAQIESFGAAIVAYEPIWAIGTGLTATPEQVQEVHRSIRDLIAGIDQTISEQMRIIYGGSLKPDNASKIFLQPDVDGGLVGGASIVGHNFLTICNTAIASV